MKPEGIMVLTWERKDGGVVNNFLSIFWLPISSCEPHSHALTEASSPRQQIKRGLESNSLDFSKDTLLDLLSQLGLRQQVFALPQSNTNVFTLF